MWPRVDSNSTCPVQKCELFQIRENVIWRGKQTIRAAFKEQMAMARGCRFWGRSHPGKQVTGTHLSVSRALTQQFFLMQVKLLPFHLGFKYMETVILKTISVHLFTVSWAVHT